MGWWGKTICTGVGAALLGPVGAGIGYAVGNALDAAYEEPSDQELQIVFFACLAKLAKSDGRISEEEILVIEAIMRERLELSQEDRKTAIEIFEVAKECNTTFEIFIDQFASLIRYDLEIGTEFLLTLYEVAIADNTVSDNEKRMLLYAESALRVEPGTVEVLLEDSRKLDAAYQLLECEPAMTDKQIKLAYRKKCIQFHPDKLSGSGLAPEFIEFANSQLAKINEAYEQICHSRSLASA